MATALHLKNTTNNGITDTGDGIVYDMTVDAGLVSDSSVTNTVASGTQIQFTKTAGGSTIAWISGRVPAGGFTLTSITNVVLNSVVESSMSANIGGRLRVFRYQPGPTITELGGGPFNDGVEWPTNAGSVGWTANPTDQAFNENDRILVRFYLTNVGTMGGGFTGTVVFGTNSSQINIAETVTFKAESPSGTISANLPKVTASMSGIAEHYGTISSNLPKITMSASGQKVETGTIASNLPKPTASMSGMVGVVVTGTLTTNLLVPTAAMTGIVAHLGTLAANLLLPTAALAGIAEHLGTISATLPLITATMTGQKVDTGTLATNLPKPIAAATGIAGHVGTITTTLPKPTAAMSGITEHYGIISTNLLMPTAAMSGMSTGEVTGVLAGNLPMLVASMIGQLVQKGNGFVGPYYSASSPAIPAGTYSGPYYIDESPAEE